MGRRAWILPRTGWYRRELPINKTLSGKRLFLYFEGANQVADVYVNGVKAGSHVGGYSAFSFDITHLVNANESNILSVRIDNSFSEDIPPLTADFNFYGGIYRDVWLIATNDLHFTTTDHASSGVRISTPDITNGSGMVAIEGTIVNASSRSHNAEIVSTVFDAANRNVAEAVSRIEVKAGRETKFSVSGLSVRSPKLWSPDSPYLYSVRNTIRKSGRTIDEVTQPLGFRWFKFDGEKGFELNGKPLKLRGTNRHQDHAGLGNAVSDLLHIRDMELIKEAGFNFVRLAHYPQDPSILEAADRLGLFIWEETPIVNYITRSKEFSENSATMVREMIRQHRNHPSVLMWGYMNEIFLRVPKGRDDLYPATVELARALSFYRFDVPSGKYEIELRFAETKFETAGKRIFDVKVNGLPFIDKLDLAQSPGAFRAFTKTTTMKWRQHKCSTRPMMNGCLCGQRHIGYRLKWLEKKPKQIRTEPFTLCGQRQRLIKPQAVKN